MRNWIRACQIIVGNENTAIDLSGLKCEFKISQSDFRFPKEATVTIYNLSENTKNNISNGEFNKIQVIAGYQDNSGLIFTGEVKYTSSGRNGVDTYITIQAVDSALANDYATINTTLSAGYTSSDRFSSITRVLDKYGITQGISKITGDIKMPRGRPEFGMCRDSLDSLAKQNNSAWYFDNGTINMMPYNGYVREIEIDSSSGLIGVPQQTINGGINVRCLINPSVTIFTQIKLNSTINQQPRNGVNFQQMITDIPAKVDSKNQYKVINISYRGDTRGNDWYMDLICVSVNDPFLPTQQLITQGM